MPHHAPHHDLIRQLDDSVAEVFAVMLNLACTPAVGAPSCVPAHPCLIASVNFSGTIEGSFTVQLAPHTAAELTSNLTGIPSRLIPPALFADTAGELCNMIAGSWKTRQPAQQAACHLSCPIVTLSSAFPAVVTQALCLLYRFNGHQMSLQLALS